MKIVLIHTFYQLRGGEDNVFEQEFDLLSEFHDVKKITFKNAKGFKGMLQFFSSIWNPIVKKNVFKFLLINKPDIVHIHNWHFASGPSIIWAAKKAKIPVIVTLHNYRLLCPSGTLLIEDKLFLNSLDAKFPWEAIRRKAFRNSSLQTLWLAFIIYVHKKLRTWNQVARYITLTPFAKDLYSRSSFGINSSKFSVKPNFVQRVKVEGKSRGEHFLFVGRLYEEKGVKILLEAFKNSPYQLHIAGDGLMKEEVLAACNDRIKFLGSLNKEQVLDAMQNCTALIFPSIWYEGMPMTMLEAFSLGTPIIASNLGSMASIVQHQYNGLHFEVSNPGDLNQQVSYWFNLSTSDKKIYSAQALATYETYYAPERNLAILEDIYRECL